VSDVAVDPRARERFPLGWWGVAMLVATESALFAMLIASYFYLRFKNDPWPPAGTPEPRIVVPLVLLGVLILTGPVLWRATHSATPRRWLVLALVVQSGYFAMEVADYQDDLHHFTPQQHAYGSLYYTLLGADHAHVALGLLFDVWLLWKLARGLNRYRANATQAIAWYWHAVNVLTIVVIGTLLSARA